MHATKIVAAVLDAETGELQFFAMTADIEKTAGFCAALPRPVRVAYEAGPTGYGLARELVSGGWSVSWRHRRRSPGRRGIG